MTGILKKGLVAVMALFAFGCAQNYYNVPRESYEKKVKALGVVPIFADSESDIRHQDKEALLALVREYNRKNEKELVTMLKGSGTYKSVRFIDADPDQLFGALLLRRERRDDAGVVYNKYFFKGDEIRTLISQNGVDAAMLLVVSGVTVRDRMFAANLVKYLESDYNNLIMTAAVIDADGAILWEYPNFRQTSPTLPALVELQYPDFDQAEANMDDKVEVKFKTIPGITRYLGKKDKDILFRDRKVSSAYYHIFDDMVSMLKPPVRLFGEKKQEAGETRPEVQPVATPVVAPVAKPQAKPEIKPEVKPEVKPSPRQEVKPEAKPDVKPEGEVVPEPTGIKEETLK